MIKRITNVLRELDWMRIAAVVLLGFAMAVAIIVGSWPLIAIVAGIVAVVLVLLSLS